MENDYFKELFAESNIRGIMETVGEMNPFITEDMNREITNEITELEI